MGLVFLVYRPAWQGGFLWDDDAHVTKIGLRSLSGLGRIWWDLGATQQYYPLVHTAFWIEHKLWGDAPLGYHLVNIFLHTLAALLVFQILQCLRVPGAFLAATIFALHPVQAETVAWITELKNTLSAVFYLGAMLSYLGFDRTRDKRHYALALALFVMGLLSKTVTATLPGGVLVIFWWQRGGLSWKKDVMPLLPFFTLGAGCGVLTAWVERKFIGATGIEFELTAVERYLIAGRAIWFYLGKLFWPAELVFLYPRWQISSAAWWQYLFPAAAAVLLLALWSIRRQTRGPLAALLFFGGTLFPALGFFNVYPFRYSFVADHFQYLASLGIITLVSAAAWLTLQRAGQRMRVVGTAICLLVLVTLALLSWRQSRMYADLETLYETTIARDPDCWMAHTNLAIALADRGRTDEAIVHYQKAIALNPACWREHNNLGVILFGRGKVAEAIAHYQKALEIKPDFADAHNNLALALVSGGRVEEAIAHYQKALEIEPRRAAAECNFGNVLAGRGQFDSAIVHYQKALEIDPKRAETHNCLGSVLSGRGRMDDAIAHYRKALELTPDYAEAHNNLGSALLSRGRIDEAIHHYQRAVEIKPSYAIAHANLGSTLLRRGWIAEAIIHYQRVVEIKPGDAKAHCNLGTALATYGRVDEAIARYRKALEIEPDHAVAYYNLGDILCSRGQVDEGIAHYQRALAIKPDFAGARRNLAVALSQRDKALKTAAAGREAIRRNPSDTALLAHTARLLATSPYASVRNGAEAVELAQRASEFSGGNNPAVLGTLAAAYAEAGRFGEAVRTAEEAERVAAATGNRTLAKEIGTQLEGYRGGKRCRLPPGQ
jgi:tetratricopeptide (TPR) repeat protein